jgi:hypothetical protein
MKNKKKMNRQYKIMKESYFNEYGVEANVYYYIMESRTFLGIAYWKSIKHQICGMGDCYNFRTKFNTIEDAEKFITEKLCTRIGHSKWVKAEIKNINC